MTLDATAVEALAIDAARSMSDGLKMLAQKEAHEAIKQERLRLAEEARRLEDIRLQLDEERKRLDQGFGRLSDDRGALEVSDSLPGSLSPIRRQTRDEPGSPLDIEADAGAGPGIPMSLPATAPGTQATVEDCQGTLTRCADEALVSVLTGRRTSLEVAGNGGRVLVDMRPSALLPLLERLDDGYQGEAGVSCEKKTQIPVGEVRPARVHLSRCRSELASRVVVVVPWLPLHSAAPCRAERGIRSPGHV